MILSVLAYLAFVALLAVAAVTDMRTLRIPNALVMGMLALWLAWHVAMGIGGVATGVDFVTASLAPPPFKGVSAPDGIVGAVSLGGGLLLVTAAYEALAKKRAMGGGDIKLLAAVGLFLGLPRGIVCLLIACAASLLLALVLPRTRWSAAIPAPAPEGRIMKEIPFGPSIAVGAVAALLI